MSGLEPPLYRYRPLSFSQATRVVIVEPALSLQSPIHIRLEEILLNEDAQTCRPYEALSYVWGDKKGSIPITCEGSTILVTPNCSSALQYLRLRDKARVLWIDAICIDQASITEKNQQVPLMGKIYESCTQAIIRLSPCNDFNTRRCNNVFRRINRLETFLSLLPMRTDSITRKVLSLLFYEIGIDDADKIYALSLDQWFERVWTIQEQFLAPKAVLMLDRSQCSFQSFVRYFINCQQDVIDGGMSRTPSSHPPFANRMSLSATFSFPTPNIRGLGLFKNSRRHDLAGDVSFWLFLCTSQNATNPLDKVYGILGIINRVLPGVEPFPVNYNKSANQVYFEFSRYLVRVTQRLVLLDIWRPPRAHSNGLPSWVYSLQGGEYIDMMPSKASTLTALSSAGMDATSGSLVDDQTLQDSGDEQLLLKGLLFSEITKTVENSNDIETWFLEVESSQRRDKGFEKVAEFVFFEAWSHSHFFRTTTGHMGISHSEVRSGDKVVLAAGARSPLALRARGDGKYVYISGVVVEGVMNGKLWKERCKSCDLETFILV